MVTTIIVSLIALVLQVFLGVVLGIFSVYLALRFFDRMTGGIDEIKELKRGNVAIAIVLLSLIAAIGMMVSTGMTQVSKIFTAQYSLPLFLIAFIMTIVQIVIVIIIAVLAIYIAIRVLDTMTVGVDELKELKRGNIAVAILIAAVVYAVSLVISGSLQGFEQLELFRPEAIAQILGVR